jgi:hypothetical protein
MSLKENSLYLENVIESFDNADSYQERLGIINELLERGFTEESNNLKECWFEERKNYLIDCGIEDSDIKIDEDGREYYEVNLDNGSPNEEGYSVDRKKEYLPNYLNVNNIQ